MNSCGATALHDAVLRGDKDIVEELMQSGANPLIQSMKGYASVCGLSVIQYCDVHTVFSSDIVLAAIIANGIRFVCISGLEHRMGVAFLPYPSKTSGIRHF
jgi:ankyrin repeat protein